MAREHYLRSVKNPGKIYGPYSRKQLQELTAKGKIKAGHEVSLDRVKWFPLSKVKPPLLPGGKSSEKTSVSEMQLGETTAGETDFDSEFDWNSASGDEEYSNLPPRNFQTSRHRNDLTVVEKYTPSGKCSRPWLIAPFVVAAPVISCLAVGIGASIGTLILIPLTAIAGGLVGMKESVMLAGLIGFVAVVAAVSHLFGLMTTIRLFNRMSHNRIAKVASLFGVLASLTIMAVFLVATYPILIRNPPESLSANHTGAFWIFNGMSFGMCLVAILEAATPPTSPYCERLKSFLRTTHQRRYPKTSRQIVKWAQEGTTEPLRNTEFNDHATDFTQVTLESCKQECCSYLKIVYFWDSDDGHGNKLQKSEVRVEGFTDRRRAATWESILEKKNGAGSAGCLIFDWLGRKHQS